MFAVSPLSAAMIVWGVVTAILIVLLIYRSLVSMKEDDQLFLDSAESNLEIEQKQVRARLARLAPYTKILGATSGVLLVAIAGIWVYEQFTSQGVLPQ
jgi:hypothetical protein